MSLTPSNNNFNNSRNYGQYDNNTGEKEKTNFRIGKLWLTNGQLECSAWKSPNGAIYTSLMIRQLIGKDPQGKSTFEAGMAKDIPSILLRGDQAQALYKYCSTIDPEKFNLVEWDPWKDDPNGNSKGSSISLIGSPGKITLTIKNKNGERSVIISGSPMADRYVYGTLDNVLMLLQAGIRLSVFNKMSEEIKPTAQQQEGVPF